MPTPIRLAAIPASTLPPLSPGVRLTLRAIVRRTVPPDATIATVRETAAGVEAHADAMPAHKRAELHRAIRVFGNPLAALVTIGVPRGFAGLSHEQQDAMLAAWSRSRIPLQRTVHQALRRLTLATYYGRSSAAAAIGYGGAFHDRTPAVPWEGPLLPDESRPVPADAAARASEAVVLRATGWPIPAVARPALPAHAHRLARDTELRADAIVIGSGAGGAVAAARLAESGLDVIVLEEGGHWDGADFTEHERDLTPRLYADRGLRATDDLSLAMLQGRTLGGGTTVNWMLMLRTPDWVLEEWAERHGAEGMRPTDLAPVFDRIERETSTATVPDEAHSANNRLVLDGARQLGWHTSPARINALGCVRSGFCGLGCRYGAKQGALRTWLPRAAAAGARVYAGVRAERLEVLPRTAGARMGEKRVTATLLDVHGGATRGTITATAPIVVLAGGAVETPALLLRSGLGGGGVGRWMRVHPTTGILGLYDRAIHAETGIPLTAMCDEFLRRDANDGYGFWLECPPMHPMLAAVAMPGFGVAHAETMAQFASMGSVIALVRDGADRERSSGGVTLDRAGRTRISYRLSPADTKQMIAAMGAAARLHLANGARETRTLHTRPVVIRTEADIATIASRPHGPNDFGLFTAHVNGTCRIGRDPRTSGTTPEGERHGVPGLYVADGSLLPTAPGVNPQETIMALATVIAGRIADGAARPSS